MIKRNFNLFLLAAVLGGAVMSAQLASAQLVLPGGATFDLFGPPGLSPERKVLLKAKDGPFNTIYGKFVLPAGAMLDWHVNPGVAIITATKGVFNEHRSNGCVSLHEAGDVFFESEGEVHKISNPERYRNRRGAYHIYRSGRRRLGDLRSSARRNTLRPRGGWARTPKRRG